MGVFTFICRSSGGEWTAKKLKGDLEASSDSTYELQWKLVQTALAEDGSGSIQSSFSCVCSSSTVFQVILGGASVAACVGGGAAAAPAGGAAAAAEAAPAGGVAAAAEAAPAKEKKEEKEDSEE